MPSVIDDGPLFFPNVVSTQEFQENGILFGSEAYGAEGLKWVVIDPGRYDLQVWQKRRTSEDFVKAGASLGAAFFTNGPMVHPDFQKGAYLYGKLGPNLIFTFLLIRGLCLRLFVNKDLGDRALAECIYDFKPVGMLQGKARSVQRQGIEASNLAHFGKNPPGTFANYVMANGDAPDGIPEAISGLIWSVEAYQPKPDEFANRFCHWGLAPLTTGPLENDTRMQAAIRDYDAYQQERVQEDPAAVAPPPLTGLLFSCTYFAPTINAILAGILLRDAIRVDGSDSVLFGRGSTVLVGNDMTNAKRAAMHWGYCVFPG